MKRILSIMFAILSIANVIAKDSYLPICTPERDYTYSNDKYTLSLSTMPSEHSDYVWFDREELFPYNTMLREEGSRVLKYFPKSKMASGWVEKVEENFTTLGTDFIYFDYNLQVGDTLCVVDMSMYDDNYLYGRIIKILSIDTIDIDFLPRLRYNLESRNFFVSISERHKDEYYASKIIDNTPYSDSWIEGIGYTSYNFDTKTLKLKTVYDNGTLVYGEDNVEGSAYLPTCAPGREYIYQDNKYGNEWRENTFLSEIFPGYIAYNTDGYYGKTLRENGDKVLRNFADLTTTPKLIDLLNENMTIINEDFVYFDYSLQIGDTLCVVEYIVTALGDGEAHVLNGKVIEVLSIEKIELGAQSLLKYNLQSRPFTAVLSMGYDSSLPPSEWDVTYHYGIEIGDTFDDAWIEGIGYTSVTGDDLIYNLQCVYEEGELIYCAEDEYIPYVKEGQEWVMIGRTGYQQYRIGGVANIDGIDYNEIYHTQSYTTVSEPELFDYVREIDRKVYIGLEGKDRLVYDFGAQAGDTIRYDHLDEGLTYYTVVDSVENKYIAGKNRTILDVTHHISYGISYGTTRSSQWIEGIGAHEDIFKNEHTYRLGASSTPDQFYYFYNSAEDIRYPEKGEIIDFSAINSVTIDNLAIYRQGDVLMAVFPATTTCDAITLYDTTGRVVVAQPIGQGATTASIDITSLPKGVYIARLGNYKGVMLAL